MQNNLPYSEACERNKDPIKQVLSQYIDSGKLLEMGFGTAQHAYHFAEAFPNVEWYACDLQANHWVLSQKLKQQPLCNLHGPYLLQVGLKTMQAMLEDQALIPDYQYFYSANTLHIMNQSEVDLFCQQVADCLSPKAKLFIYGPFKYDGTFTSESNQQFDQILRARGVGSCIKEFNDLVGMLAKHEINFLQRFNLPANNQLLVFQRS